VEDTNVPYLNMNGKVGSLVVDESWNRNKNLRFGWKISLEQRTRERIILRPKYMRNFL